MDDFPRPLDDADERPVEDGPEKDDRPEQDQGVDHLSQFVHEGLLQHLSLEPCFSVVAKIGP